MFSHTIIFLSVMKHSVGSGQQRREYISKFGAQLHGYFFLKY